MMMVRGHLFFLLNLQIMKTRKHSKRGGGYGFGGSLLDGSSSNSGNTLWKSDTGTDCSTSTARAGNGFAGGRRRRHKGGQVDASPSQPQTISPDVAATLKSIGGRRRKYKGKGKSRRRYKGGGHDLAQNVPRANYSFQGEGTKGLVDWAHDTY